MTETVDLGPDGIRIIVGFDPAPPPPINKRIKSRRNLNRKTRKKSSDRIYDIREGHSVHTDFVCIRHRHISQFRNKPGMPDYRRTRVPDGMTKQEAVKMWAEAKRKAKITMEIIKNTIPLDDERAEQALEAALEVMHAEHVHMDTKLKAAKIILEYTKAKPATRQDVTINRVEDWLSEIATKADGK